MLKREVDCLEFCCGNCRGVRMTFRVEVIVNRVGEASSVICFGTVGVTDVGILVVDDKRLEAVSVGYRQSTFLG